MRDNASCIGVSDSFFQCNQQGNFILNFFKRSVVGHVADDLKGCLKLNFNFEVQAQTALEIEAS